MAPRSWFREAVDVSGDLERAALTRISLKIYHFCKRYWVVL